MRRQQKQFLIEWGFVILLVALCAILTVLQYRWTGQVSRAEAERLRAGVEERAQRFCDAFDATLAEYCTTLTPAADRLMDENRESIHKKLFQQWKATNPRPIFSRVAVAVPSDDEVTLYSIGADGAFSAMAWPKEWRSLQQNLAGKRRPGGPPFRDQSGLLFESPIFGGRPDRGGGPPRGGPGENEWIIFELDTNYLCNTWLPGLARRYLSPAEQDINDIVVREAFGSKAVVYASRADAAKNSETPVKIKFNNQGRDPSGARGPTSDFRWILEVRARPDALEAIVAASRERNLAVAIGLNGLILAAGLALITYARRSRQLAEAQLNFVANVSHELRTPLTVIRGAAHNMKRGVVQERGQIEQYSGLIMQHVEQLGEMVEQILQLAGARKNRVAFLREPVSVAEVLNDAIAATAHETQTALCEVELELPPSLPAVTGDAAALRRVFQNLITNAAKHGGTGGWIGISAVVDEDSGTPVVEIQVADRGPGIPADERAEIFKPFFRGAKAQSEQIRGSGLGLNLVKEIIEAHGGRISVRSESGQGTVFIVRLPSAKITPSK